LHGLIEVGNHNREKNFMFTWTFWKQALERLIRAFASSLLSLTGADAFNVVSTNWGDKLPIALGASVVSLLLSIVAATGISGTKGDPSLVDK
jgi:hypothetical protein